MKNKRYILLVALALLGACDYPFDPKTDVEGDRMFLQAYVTERDTTFIRLSRTVPLYADRVPGTDYRIKEFRVRAGGQEVDVQRKDDRRWYFVGHNAPGTVLDLYVKAAGIEAVSAETVVPDAPAVASARQDAVRIGERDYAKVTVTLAEDPEPDAYYGMTYLLENTSHWTMTWEDGMEEGQDTVVVTSLYPLQPGESVDFIAELSAAMSRTVFSFNPSWKSGEMNMQLQVFRGREIQGRTLEQFYSLYTDSEQEYEWGEGNKYSSKSSYRWKVKFYRLSDACYNYLTALSNESYSGLASFGLIPPGFTYSNVRGGYGAFVSLSCTETPWKNTLPE